MERKQKKQIINDLEKKMVFLVGPRQVGKTWLARDIAKSFNKPYYLNYDNFEERKIIKRQIWPNDIDLLIFDEIHKMKEWKNYLKGVYDTKLESVKILVTASARLETFRQSGDSLAGRFFIHRLLPLSLKEVNDYPQYANIDRFLIRSGFPEPFLAKKELDANRWRRQYVDSLIREDILDFERIHDLKSIKLVFEILRRKVGSPISYKSIAQDVGISPITVKKYISIFESLFIIFSVKPYFRKISRSILKEPKIYFYDSALVKANEGIILENFVAVSLLKSILGEKDSFAKNIDLMHLRTKDGKEVDFAIIEDDNVREIIEVKLSNSNLSKNLKYFSDKYNIKAVQLVKDLNKERRIDDVNIVKVEDYLKNLYL